MIGSSLVLGTYKAGDVTTRLARDHGLMLCPSSRLTGSLVSANLFSESLRNEALVLSGVSGKYMYPMIAIGMVMMPSMRNTLFEKIISTRRKLWTLLQAKAIDHPRLPLPTGETSLKKHQLTCFQV